MKELEDYLNEIYPSYAEKITSALSAYMSKLYKEQPNNALPRTPYWYKHLVMYAVYPESVQYDKNYTPLANLVSHIPHLRQLGCDLLHILPFLKSPMIDKGFDVSDYYTVRKDLGSVKDLARLKKEADKAGIRLVMDLVLNHVSDQHSWFQKAQKNDPKYREFFLYRKEKPKFIRKYLENSAVWAEYEEQDAIAIANIAFPEMTGELPHWRQAKDGYWYYHTYYPQQLDLNWCNHEVFIEVAKIMLYWASKGFHFRLDAIPFVGKSVYKSEEKENYRNGVIIASLKSIAEYINPEIIFIGETFERLPIVIERFGTAHRVQTNLTYHFHLCTKLWVSLITKNIDYVWETLQQPNSVPEHAEWLNFLRNHDELSLAYLDDEVRKQVMAELLPLGKAFREGCGVSGRTFAFLKQSKKRFYMAYFLLASFPGSLLIPYGDEFAFKNIPLSKLSRHERVDTRNINRGIIDGRQLQGIKHQEYVAWLSTLLARRKQFKPYFKTPPQRLTNSATIYGASHQHEFGQLLIYVNLAKQRQQISLTPGQWQIVCKANNAYVWNNTLELGAYAGAWLIDQAARDGNS